MNLGIISPRTLSLDFSNYIVKSDTPIKLAYTLAPALLDEESMQFESSDESVVTVADDGTMTYVGDGTTTVVSL